MNLLSPAIDAPCAPFLKWAGGKRWFLGQFDEIVKDLKFDRYVEPFVGSGAVFFHLRPQNALLADSNQQLINTYVALRDNYKQVVKYLVDHNKKHSRDYYYEVRPKKFKSPYAAAAQFLYLNRTCWNGLYRVNLKGEFNVPMGTKTDVLFDVENFPGVASSLKSTTLLCQDFEGTINLSGKGDLLFIDPPYTVRHNKNGFIKYNEKLFSWDDQERLYQAVKSAKDRGAQVVMTNANHESIQSLYSGGFELRTVSRFSAIAASGMNRGKFEELLITGG